MSTSVMEEEKGMEDACTLTVDDQGLAHLVIDVPDQTMNTFSTSTLKALGEALDEVRMVPGVKALLIKSGKQDSYIAGADIDELRSLKTKEEARALVELGQQTFNKIEALQFPTIAVIHGVCVGGGMEMALACSHRMVSDDPKTKLGLPEVQLGLIPGWGGTQRMPKLIGVVDGVTLVTSGKQVPGKKALKMGLADKIFAAQFMDEQAAAFALKAASFKRKPLPLMKRMMGWPGLRDYVFSQAKKTIMQKSKGHYPAPLKALEVIRKTAGLATKEGLPIEADGILAMVEKEETANLIQLFFTNEALKKNSGFNEEESALKPRPIGHTAVLGAGIMGSGITWLLANGGKQVRLKDIKYEALGKGLSQAWSYQKALIKRRKIKKDRAIMQMQNISTTITPVGFGRTELVIEAVDERYDLKKLVYEEIEGAISEECILATNTSSMQVSDLAKLLKHPRRFVGLHFFNPVNRMPLVEVVRGDQTDPQVIVDTVELLKKLKKTPIVVADCAGFLVNRILIPAMLEAGWLLEEGVPMEQLDKAMEKWGMPMGPCVLADEVGLDIAAKASGVLEKAYGKRMEVPKLFKEMVSEELFGKKSGAGFYVHEGKNKSPNPTVTAMLPAAKVRMSEAQIVERSALIMINEASRCLDEEIVTSAEVLDMGSIMGFGFPPFRGGVLRYADTIGAAKIVERLESLEQQYGERFSPSDYLKQMAKTNQTFYEG